MLIFEENWIFVARNLEIQDFICTFARFLSLLLSPIMKKIFFICFVLTLTLSAMAEDKYALTYQGYTYRKLTCEDPTYAAGEVVKLSSASPDSALWFKGWAYNGVIYAPGADFTMPAADVELVPVFAGEGLSGDVVKSNVQCTKEIRNGQLLIKRGDKYYNALGSEVK